MQVGLPPMKSTLLEKIRIELRARLARLAKAAQDAHAAATDPGSKAEGKYDTRSLEASYLAAGQARQVDELAESLRIFEALSALPEFAMDDPIDAGALVEVELRGETSHLLLVPAAGGLLIEEHGCEITLLSPASELYRKLLGMVAGDSLGQPALLVIEVS
ncbi:MAG: transcription elongation factor GreAB [Verrucomicrobia bacterium]|nr:MAG: transcription elongation factor GreAB [Verrucomicrobiota bacterium]